jgi:hypothetical protein
VRQISPEHANVASQLRGWAGWSMQQTMSLPTAQAQTVKALPATVAMHGHLLTPSISCAGW